MSVTSEYISGTTAVSLVETSTSDDLEEWSDWAAVPSDGKDVYKRQASQRVDGKIILPEAVKVLVQKAS